MTMQYALCTEYNYFSLNYFIFKVYNKEILVNINANKYLFL